MTTYTWTPGINGDWLTATNWQPATVPGVADTAIFQPASGSGSYSIGVGVDDVVGVSQIQFSSAPGQNAVLSIAGSATVGTLDYAAFEVPAQVNVAAGGSLEITSAITDDTATPETLSVAGAGDGGSLILGSTSINNAAVTFDFVNAGSGGNNGSIVFNSGYAPGITVTQTINNFAVGDALRFANANFTGDTATYDPGTTTLTVSNSSSTLVRMVNVTAPAGESFNLAGGSIIAAVCYASGTRLLTPTGERRVEALRPGDEVVTLVGDEQIVQPIKWIGRRRLDLARCARPDAVAPIRIRRGAFADDIPRRDLRVSPDHAILVDGRLVCARQLVNFMSIQQERHTASVEYFHVELAAHAILLAEGLPAESYLNTGNSGFFANADLPLILHPGLTDRFDHSTREMGSAAPFVHDEETIRPIWQRLADRARARGQTMPRRDRTGDPDLYSSGRWAADRPVASKKRSCRVCDTARNYPGAPCITRQLADRGQAVAGGSPQPWRVHETDCVACRAGRARDTARPSRSCARLVGGGARRADDATVDGRRGCSAAAEGQWPVHARGSGRCRRAGVPNLRRRNRPSGMITGAEGWRLGKARTDDARACYGSST